MGGREVVIHSFIHSYSFIRAGGRSAGLLKYATVAHWRRRRVRVARAKDFKQARLALQTNHSSQCLLDRRVPPAARQQRLQTRHKVVTPPRAPGQLLVQPNSSCKQQAPTLPSMEPERNILSSEGWKSMAVTKSVCLHRGRGEEELGAVGRRACEGDSGHTKSVCSRTRKEARESVCEVSWVGWGGGAWCVCVCVWVRESVWGEWGGGRWLVTKEGPSSRIGLFLDETQRQSVERGRPPPPPGCQFRDQAPLT